MAFSNLNASLDLSVFALISLISLLPLLHLIRAFELVRVGEQAK